MKLRYSLILAVSFMIFYNVTYGVEIIDCATNLYGNLLHMEVSGCNISSSRCVFKRGTSVQIKMGFTIFEDASDVIASANAEQGVDSFSLGAYHACLLTSGLICPLREGTVYEYKGILNVLAEYPKMHALVTWKLLDENKNKIVCVKFPATFL